MTASSGGTSTISNYNGWFKEVYEKSGIDNAIPDEALLTKLVSFKGGAERIGNKFHRPVRLRDEQGVTFSDGTGAPQLAAAISGQTQDAYIQSNEIIARGRLSYSSMARAVDTASFGDITEQLISSLRRSAGKKLEVELLYGQASIGKIASVTNTSGNLYACTIVTSEWAPYIWVGQEGMPIDYSATAPQYSNALTVSGTVNSQGYLSGIYGFDGSDITQSGWVSGSIINTAGAVTVYSVNITNYTVTLQVTSGTAPAANDYLYFGGAYGVEMVGLHNILNNTGVLFGISAAQYSLWQGNNFSVGGVALSYATVLAGLNNAVSKGLNGDIVLLVSFNTFQSMNADVGMLKDNTSTVGARQIDYSYDSKMQDIGSMGIRFFYQGGKVDVIPSGFVKQGYAYAFKKENFDRIGSRDLTFEIPGRPGNFVLDVQDYAMVEWRCYSDQSLFTTNPAHGVVFSGIVNPTNS